MSKNLPSLEDYVNLFRSYGKDLGTIYTEPDDDRYALLFEQIICMLIKPSAYNSSIPKQFRIAAQSYYEKDSVTYKHLREPANRHFMLCDFYDWVMLNGGLALLRRVES
ncbi:MAG: hypothetical protein TECD_00534 [Hyphomicrobiaceae bacterium hypho_1]